MACAAQYGQGTVRSQKYLFSSEDRYACSTETVCMRQAIAQRIKNSM